MWAICWTRMYSGWEREEGIFVDKIKKFKLAPMALRFSDLQQENKVCRGDSPYSEWNVLIYV